MHSFHNTIDLRGEQLARAHARAATQEEIVLGIFHASHKGLLTPEDVLRLMPARTPITSVRRAMTNLTERGQLVKTEHFTLGQYGVRVHYWSLVTPQRPLL